MRYYVFSVGSEAACVRIGLLASSREEAVASVREELERYRRRDLPGLPGEWQDAFGRPEFSIEMSSPRFELIYVAFRPDQITEANIVMECDPEFRAGLRIA